MRHIFIKKSHYLTFEVLSFLPVSFFTEFRKLVTYVEDVGIINIKNLDRI